MAKYCSFHLDTRRALADGSYPVQIYVGNGRRIYLSTGVSCLPEHWNPALSEPYSGPRARQINGILKTLLSQVSLTILELRENGRFDALTNKQLRELLEGREPCEPENNIPKLGDVFRRYIKTRGKRTGELYLTTLRKLEAFCEPDAVGFDDITKLWLSEFEASMSGLSANGRAIHMRNLRAVINVAIDEGITQNYPFRRFRIQTEKTRKRSLDVDMIRRIRDAQLSPRLARYRDLFMLGFYLIGINVVDLCRLMGTEDGRIEYNRAKTGRHYSIKVEPEAQALIEKYKGESHLLYMLDTNADYRSFYRHFAAALREIGAQMGIELTTYWARHSWATIARAAGVSVDDIALALGHGDGHDLTHIYIREDLSRVDDANRRVLDFVLYGKKETGG